MHKMGQVLLSGVLHCQLIKLMDDKMINFEDLFWPADKESLDE